ncbi:MAG: hypothetical protein AAF458_15470 [Pseudomonadota bacterium]
MTHADGIFYKQFSIVLVLLAVAAIISGILASSIGGDALTQIRQSPSAVQERIAPVGTVVTSEPKATADATGAKPAAEKPKQADGSKA